MLASILRSPHLRRIELAFVLFALGEFGVWLAVMVYAYQHGGTTTAALIATLQLVPAIVAREYGIPGVVGTRDATSRIPDGSRVRVDGEAGVVTILE